MPYYEYKCAESGRTVEVRHRMSESPRTWGELVAVGGIEAGDTPLDAPVERLMSAPVPLAGPGAAADGGFQGCGSGCACAPHN